MINVRSLRFRLALWYFCTVAAICLLAGVGYWFAIDRALRHALDEGLRYRIIGLHQFLEEMDPSGLGEIATRLGETSELAELYEVFDANGVLIAQSAGLERHHVLPAAPRDLGRGIRYQTGGPRDFQLRLAWEKVNIGGQTLILAGADPQKKYEGVLRAFNSVVLFSAPVILILATGCGLWLGRRALAPVARIAEDAHAITETNLSARLAVPDSQDELQQLSETLNEMLDRIEQSFTRTKQFTADASHELAEHRMTLIRMAAQFSLRKERSREELVESMQKILRESKRTSTLIDDLLLLARGDYGRESAELTSVDVVPLLRDLNEQASTIAAAKDIQLALHLPSESSAHQRIRAKTPAIVSHYDGQRNFGHNFAGGSVTVSSAKDETAPQFLSSIPESVSPQTICRTSSSGSGVRIRYGPETRAAPALVWQSPCKLQRAMEAALEAESEVGRWLAIHSAVPKRVYAR